MTNGDLTTAEHHVFWYGDQDNSMDDWLKAHLIEMEGRGFRVTAATTTKQGICFVMVLRD